MSARSQSWLMSWVEPQMSSVGWMTASSIGRSAGVGSVVVRSRNG